MSQKYYSVRDAAEKLGVHMNTVYKMIHRGQITAKGSGPRTTVIAAEELDNIEVIKSSKKPIIVRKEDLA